MRKLINPHQKAQIALLAIKDDKTLAQLSSEYHVHPSQISEWKGRLQTCSHKLFGPNGKTKEQHQIEELQRMIGKREEEIDWLKKKLSILP